MYTAKEVAEYIICRCNLTDVFVSNLKLQKFLYLIQVEYLRCFGEPCFSDDFEAWDIGPIVRDVYNRYCGFGGSGIILRTEARLAEPDEKIINEIIYRYKNAFPWEMSDKTMGSGSPWEVTYDNGRGAYRIILVSRLLKGGKANVQYSKKRLQKELSYAEEVYKELDLCYSFCRVTGLEMSLTPEEFDQSKQEVVESINRLLLHDRPDREKGGK